MNTTPHLDLAQWRAFFEQSMSEADREVALDHIASCAQCAGVFRSARTAALNVVGTPAVAPARAPGTMRILVPIAATLSIGVIAGIVMSRNAPTTVISEPPVAVQAPAQPVPATPPRPALIKPPIVIGAEQLLAPRGDDDSAKYLQSLADALRPYEGDDFTNAIALLEPIAKAHPDRFEPVFYLGAALMMNGRAGDAVPVLERAVAIASAARREDAERTLAAARQAARP